MKKFTICCILAATLILLCGCNTVQRANYKKNSDSVYTSAYIQMRHAFAQHEGVEDEAFMFGSLSAREISNIEKGYATCGDELVTVYTYSIKGVEDGYFGTISPTVWDMNTDIIPPAGVFPVKDGLLVYGVNGNTMEIHNPADKKINRIADELGYKMSEVKSIIDYRYKSDNE